MSAPEGEDTNPDIVHQDITVSVRGFVPSATIDEIKAAVRLLKMNRVEPKLIDGELHYVIEV